MARPSFLSSDGPWRVRHAFSPRGWKCHTHRRSGPAPNFPAETGRRSFACDREARLWLFPAFQVPSARSEEHTSELQSLMRISYAVFCLKKKTKTKTTTHSQSIDIKQI